MAMYQQIPKNSMNRLEAVTGVEAPPGLVPLEMGKNEYQELQKQAYVEKKMDKRVKRLEALMDCVKDLGVIERSMDSLTDRLDVSVEDTKAQSRPTRTKPVVKQADEMKKAKAASKSEPDWYKKESKSHAGRFYWVNKKTGQTVWKMPENWKEPESDKLSPSDGEASTDAGYTSVSDYDSDVIATSSRKTGFRADAPVFKPSSPTTSDAAVFRADAPVFQPTSSIEVAKDALLRHRVLMVQKGDLTTSTKPGDIIMKPNSEITYADKYF